MNKFFRVRKVMIALIMMAVVLASIGSTASYADEYKEGTEVNSFFISFIDEAFNDISKFKVKNKDKEDITDYFLDETREIYANKDYDLIHKIILDRGLSISIINIIEDDNYGLMASRTQTFSEYEYKEERARNGHGTLVWATLLTGKVTYDPNTGRVITATNPTLRLHYQSGGWEQPAEMINVSTSRVIYSSYVEFKGRYKMIHDLTVGFDDGTTWVGIVDYGTHTHYMDAYPEP